MKIHRFVGPNSRDVMRQVRDALGDDALIVSNRSVPEGIEVLATLESDVAQAHPAEPAAAAPRPAEVAPTISPRADSFLANRSSAAYGAAMSSDEAVADAPAANRFAPSAAPVASRQDYRPEPRAELRQPGVAQPIPPQTSAPAAAASQAAAPRAEYRAPAPQPAPAARPPSMARMPDAPMRNAALPPAQGDMPSVQAAIDALRGALENRMDGLLWGGRKQGREPINAGLFRALLEAGFSMPLVRALLERLPADLDSERARAWARNELLTHLPVLRDESAFLSTGGVLALVGPTGVGKTTTLAKLAARCVAREGRDQVAMLTTDNFRIGALEQLQIYGRLMGVPAHSIRDAEELRDTLAKLGDRKIILIDTTGISQRDRNVAEQAALLCGAGRPVRRLLVLNAASQGDTLDEVAHAYRNGVGEDVVGCIITKLDEATRLAPALDTAIRHRLPIHYISNGQKVPEHLVPAQAQPLVDHALATLEHARALYAPSEADLAALWQSTPAKDPERQRRLLATAMAPGAVAKDTAIDAALEWMGADPACKQGRVLWRALSRAPAVEAARAQVVNMLKREFPAHCNRYVLAVHGKTPLKGEGLPGGALHATLIMSDRGTALAAPAQHLLLPHGALNTFGVADSADQPPEAMLERMGWLRDELGQLPQVHLFEMGTAAHAQALSEAGALWLARSTGSTKILQDECPTTLNAVARPLGYMPAGEIDGQALWACGTEVNFASRGHEETRVRMICARLVDASGEVSAQYFGLTNLSPAQADAATIATWLVHQERAKTAFRYMAHAWSALPAPMGAEAMRAQAMLSGQLAAACWQLSHAEQAQAARSPLAGLVGPAEKKMPSRLLPVALLKMYALLEMAE